MIFGFLHPGSGLGNQLFRYVATRVRAADLGVHFSMIGRENFKGSSFMNTGSTSMGITNNLIFHIEQPAGKIVLENADERLNIWEEETNHYNPEFNFIEDNTIIDGEFQSIQYFGHRLIDIDEWLKVEPMDIPDDVCVIGFRGGEFYVFPELGLPKEYFTDAMRKIYAMNPDITFEVHTDDEDLARKFFPHFKIIHDVGINWRSMRYAKYAIIANSSFYILPRLLNGGMTIAPRYWARRNIKEWSRPDNYYPQFKYI